MTLRGLPEGCDDLVQVLLAALSVMEADVDPGCPGDVTLGSVVRADLTLGPTQGPRAPGTPDQPITGQRSQYLY